MRLKPFTRSFIITAAAVSLLAGCGAKENAPGTANTEAATKTPAEDGNPNSGKEGTVAPSDKPDAAKPVTGGGETAADPKTPSSNTADQKPGADIEKKKLYKMNKVYRFVPIDKSSAPEKVVLLTFDDGPKDDAMLTSMLDTLDKHKAKAIFFVNGYRVKKNPELLTKIADRGQTIGNHSWDHIDLKKETSASVMKQVGDVQKIVKDTVGKAPVFFRPPFGSGGDEVKKIVKNHGMLFMTWSNGSLDWDKSTKDKPDKVIENVLEQLHPGANILMHELPWTAEALDSLLTKLEQKGYGFIDPAAIDLELQPGGAK
ncbi:polysaccharide deacetylase family protein [Paenibacillus spongiae]|uniref:Polysaccharide deacetylase family protein n=1 Tax=Paenibacillus spongiae TaxID=2909671 RepID=A0ABY5SEF7_9BACL|nr:polysaccharide deacetylase family protein [Paenibacillus spongiae]UVI32362.1 polysaccharide deacetylase family protein [Paenibacillus spongiae]